MKVDPENGKTGHGRILSSRVQRPAFCRRGGFTLMELLLVMVIIAILGSVIMGSATFITRVARKRRAEVARVVLEAALTRYRSDYNKWPIGGLVPVKGLVTAVGADNAKIFGKLRETNGTSNPRGIRYFDETTLYTLNAAGKTISLRQAGSGEFPLVYMPREGGAMKYFKVVINIENDTAKVTAPELGN